MKWLFKTDNIESQFSEKELSFWIVWSPGKGEPTKRHTSCQEARDEAKRLAELNPGQEFIVLKADSCYSIQSQRAIYYQ